ncbi:MAG: hypothetical protein ACFFEY_16090 [Candidatus Thorarchaeota archaeon]
MSNEEILRDQINKIAIKIEEVEQTAKQKENYITNKLCEEYDPKMSQIEVNLLNQKAKLNELIKNIDELTSQKNELVPIVKNLEKEYIDLKTGKEKALKEKMKAIMKEKKNKTKIIEQQIKNLEKELKAKEKT